MIVCVLPGTLTVYFAIRVRDLRQALPYEAEADFVITVTLIVDKMSIASLALAARC